MRTSESKAGLAISRRALLGVTGALPLPSNRLSAPECESWLAKEAQTNRLASRWSAVESHLAKHHGWFTLCQAERLALPEAAEMREIDARLERLSGECAHVIPKLPSLAATSRTAILLKFEVLAHVLRREEHRDEHALLRSTLRDLKAAWLTPAL
jgi:hypothetical protein